MWQEYVRHLLINSPLEASAMRLRGTVQKLRSDNDPKWAEVRAEDGYVEQMLPRLIKNGDNCVDIGGHLGAMLSKMSKLSPTGKHVVIEALPYKAAWLRKKFPGAVVHEVALSDAPGEATFFHQTQASGFSGLKFHGNEEAAAAKIIVQCQRLDDLLKPEVPVDFIKIDIEGGERDALRGARNTLSRWQPAVLFECTESGTGTFGHTVGDIYDLLAGQHGYDVFWIKDWLVGGTPLTREAHTKLTQFPAQAFNFLAVHPHPRHSAQKLIPEQNTMMHLPHTTQFTRAQKQKQAAYAWAAAALSVFSAAAFVAFGLDNLLVPFTLLFCVALPILLWRLPRLVLYLTLGVACLIELEPSGSPDALTDRIPFFWNINTIFQIYAHVNLKAAPINFFELFVLVAGLCSLFRAVFSGTAKARGGDLWKPIAVYIAFVLLAWINGITSGGDFKISLQEVRGQFYFFLIYLMAVNIVEDRKQVGNLLWVSMICIAVKGALYTFRRYVTLHGEPLSDQGVGSHEEAFFFDLFALLLCSLALFGVHKKLQWFMILVLPLVLLGNLATNRRAGTADIALMTPVLFLAAYAGLPKRRALIGRIALASAVLGLGYYQVGQKSSATWAQPARAIHSQFAPDDRDLRSNQYRDAENFNQMATIKANPLGYGYGKPFFHLVPMADISQIYIFWDILPHNQILWIWMRTGILGFYAFWLAITIAIVYACRFIRDEQQDSEIKMLALFAILCVGSLLVFGLLDLQLSNFRDLIFVGVWLGVLARLKHLTPPPLVPEATPATGANAALVPFVPANNEIIRPVRRALPKRRWIP